MNIKIRKYSTDDVKDAIDIWNTVVKDGIAFPQEECLDQNSGNEFFKSQTYTGIAYDADTDLIVGLYILHPNNVGDGGSSFQGTCQLTKD